MKYNSSMLSKGFMAILIQAHLILPLWSQLLYPSVLSSMLLFQHQDSPSTEFAWWVPSFPTAGSIYWERLGHKIWIRRIACIEKALIIVEEWGYLSKNQIHYGCQLKCREFSLLRRQECWPNQKVQEWSLLRLEFPNILSKDQNRAWWRLAIRAEGDLQFLVESC